MEQAEKQPLAQQPVKPAAYEAPKLTRWGTLRELTAGGGGTKTEPTTKRTTRF
jgi:hypothetical protein